MQQLYPEQSSAFVRWWILGLVVLVGFGLYFGSQVEGPGVPSAPVVAAREFDGVQLKLAMPETALKPALRNLVSAWAGETGARVEIVTPNGEAADLAIIRAPELGALAATNQLVSLPVDCQSAQHPAQWNRIAVTYRLELCQWGGTIFGVPLSGENSVVVYRADKFRNPQHIQAYAKKFAGRQLGPMALTTWEEWLDLAEYFSQVEQRPSLPPVPLDPRRLLLQFQQIAASYDRLATVNSKELRSSQGFFFDSSTGQPRLLNGSFREAAEWFSLSAKYRSAPTVDRTRSEQLQALLDDKAIMAVLTAEEVGQLPRDESGEISPRFGVTRLPGTRSWFPAPNERRPLSQVNYVPFVGFETQLGVVFNRKNPTTEAAAWSLLLALSSPDNNVALLSDPSAGVGPIREDQLGTTDRDSIWFNYRFDGERTTNLADAFRNYLPRTVSRPVITLRSPDQGVLLQELEARVRRVANGEISSQVALSLVQTTWEKLIAEQSAAEVKRWRQSDSGVRE